MRRFAPAALIVIPIVVFVAWHRHGERHAFRLAEPMPTTIRALGQVERPREHSCTASISGKCFDYVGDWCQAPCATYRVSGTVVRVRRVDHWQTLWVMVLRDGGASIAARVLRKPRVHPGDRVRVSGVLFFPTPRGRDGGHSANGAELSPVLAVSSP